MVKERKAYVILVLISVFLTVSVYYQGRQDLAKSDHEFCQLINASLAGQPKPTKPADPAHHKSEERLYENYVIVHDLGHNLGCL